MSWHLDGLNLKLLRLAEKHSVSYLKMNKPKMTKVQCFWCNHLLIALYLLWNNPQIYYNKERLNDTSLILSCN